MAALVGGASIGLLAAGPAQPGGTGAASLERIRREVTRPASLGDAARSLQAVPLFRTRVDERVYVLPFREQLEKDLELTPLQRQSQEWASKCCGINLISLWKGVDQALRRREARNARERVARELAEVVAANR